MENKEILSCIDNIIVCNIKLEGKQLRPLILLCASTELVNMFICKPLDLYIIRRKCGNLYTKQEVK